MPRGKIPTSVSAGLGVMAHNVPLVCDVSLSPTRAKGYVVERRAAAPRSPRRLLRRRCAYVLLDAVAPFFSAELSRTVSGSSEGGCQTLLNRVY
jgi:hypothetical protein